LSAEPVSENVAMTSLDEREMSRWVKLIRSFALCISLLAVAFVILLLVYLYSSVIWIGTKQGTWFTIITNQFLISFGVPIAVICAFCVVQLFRGIHGPIVIESKWAVFKGATGPVILWIICFLAVVFAEWLLWK